MRGNAAISRIANCGDALVIEFRALTAIAATAAALISALLVERSCHL